LLASGAGPGDLARPSAAGCTNCRHRAWCDSYWLAGTPGSEGGDVEGTVINVDGWLAELESRSGERVTLNSRALRVTPSSGMRVRVCGARAVSVGVLLCRQGTSLWRLPS
jgi:hypothetical protein